MKLRTALLAIAAALALSACLPPFHHHDGPRDGRGDRGGDRGDRGGHGDRDRDGGPN